MKEMKSSLVFMPTAIALIMGAALSAQPPAGMHNPGQRLENMLTKTLSLNATQQGQVHTILADALTLAVAMFLAKNDEVDSVVAVADGE